MPASILWFRVYAVLLALSYLFVLGLGVTFLVLPPETLEMEPLEAQLLGGVFIALGFLFFIAVLPSFFLPRRKWGWIYGLVLICLGLTSALFLPICIPLLIFWLKEPVKAWFEPIAP